jgi:hypothetical protein
MGRYEVIRLSRRGSGQEADEFVPISYMPIYKLPGICTVEYCRLTDIRPLMSGPSRRETLRGLLFNSCIISSSFLPHKCNFSVR